MRPFALLAMAALAVGVTPLAGQDKDKDQPRIRRQTDLVSYEEIEAIRDQVPDVRSLVQRLRPQFLRPRGASSFGNARSGRSVPYARVVVDGVPRGDLEILRQLPAASVREIRYLSAADATTRFGTGFDGGAILIVTR